MSLYSHAGVSRQNGKLKVRFANDAMRVKVLQKNGHKDIDIIEMKKPMTKEDAVAYLLSIDFDNGNREVRAALEEAADKRGVVAKAPKATAKAKAKAPAKTAVAKTKTGAATVKPAVQSEAQAVAKVESALSNIEDAPF